jgi:uncharacterized protein YndB with AHSA1/START domain
MELLLTIVPAAEAGMLIRKPTNEVYEAFINPAITTQFWFSKCSCRLEVGRLIRWDREMYGVSTMVEEKELVPGKRILVELDVDKLPTRVAWTFSARTSQTTFVGITNSGFSGDGDKIVEQAKGSTAGFGLVLAGLKAYLEPGITHNLVEDRYPDQLVNL